MHHIFGNETPKTWPEIEGFLKHYVTTPCVVIIDDGVEIMSPAVFNQECDDGMIPLHGTAALYHCGNLDEMKRTLYPWWHEGETMPPSYTMRVTVVFHPRDDVSQENQDLILDLCLTTDELRTAYFYGHTLTYTTPRKASDIVADWEEQGFNIDEFDSFQLSSIT